MTSDHHPKEEHLEENALSNQPPAPDAAAPDDHAEAALSFPKKIESQKAPPQLEAAITEPPS